MPELTIDEIAKIIDGSITGDGSITINAALGLESAQAGSITFVADKKALSQLDESNCSAAIIPQNAEGEFKCTVIRADNPRIAFVRVAQQLAPKQPRPATGVHRAAVIAEGVELGSDVCIGANVVIESGTTIGAGSVINAGSYIGNDCKIGSNCVINPNVTIYFQSTIGNNVIIHAGAVIGADGFGFQWDGKEQLKIPQVGVVVIEDNVEIGANSTIDRARFGTTLIKQGCKFDNLTHVAHNCTIGEHSVFAGLVGVSGSVTTGNNVTVGGQVGFADHINIGSNCIFYAKSGVTADVPDNNIYAGQPAKDIRTALKEYHNMRGIGDLKKKVKSLEKELEQIKNETANTGN